MRGARRHHGRAPARDLRARLDALAADPVPAADAVVAETDAGRLLLHAEDCVMTPLIRRDGRWAPDEGAWLRATLQPGDTVIDCGANVGYFTILAARAVGPAGAVVAVEPDAANLRLLRANVWHNGCDNVAIVPAGASDQRGLLALRRSAKNFGDHQVHAQARAGEFLVPGVALDELLDGARVDALMIGTQGADHLVVAGLRRTLATNPHAPALVQFWLDALAQRGVAAATVLAGYRNLRRPLGLLGAGGAVTPATDAEIMAAAQAAPDRSVILVLGKAARREGANLRPVSRLDQLRRAAARALDPEAAGTLDAVPPPPPPPAPPEAEPAWIARDRQDGENMRRLVAFVLAPDDSCIDIGSHRGSLMHEFLRVAPGGRHIAVEPLPHLAEHLRQTFPDVTVVEAAASDEEGETTFAHVRAAEGWSGLKYRPLPGDLEPDLEEITVKRCRVDTLVDPEHPPRLVKIDVEGAEEQVIRGLMGTLRDHRPVVIFEHGSGSAEHFGTGPRDVHRLFVDEARMRIFDLDGNGPYDASEFERVFQAAERVNFVARP